MDWERTITYGPIFLAEMERIQPGWVQVRNAQVTDAKTERNFTIKSLITGFHVGLGVYEWLDRRVERGWDVRDEEDEDELNDVAVAGENEGEDACRGEGEDNGGHVCVCLEEK